MTVGSLFSGIGGFEKGFEDAGFRTIWQCEQDDFCTQVLNKHWPNVPVFRDVRELYTEGGESPEKPDVITAGFPCTDISLAGKGAGLEGEKSRLWWEAYRITRLVRPRYLVLENVPALVGRGLPAILGALSEIGYDVEWEIVSAAALGAPHLRERIFIVAYPTGMGRQARCEEARRKAGDGAIGSPEGAPVADSQLKHRRANDPRRCRDGWEDDQEAGRHQGAVEFKGCRQNVADTNEERCNGAGAGPKQAGWRKPADGSRQEGTYWTTQPRVRPLASGIPRRMERIRAFGNAIVPQVAEYVGRLVMQHASQQQPSTP